jgi:hypothetical protein
LRGRSIGSWRRRLQGAPGFPANGSWTTGRGTEQGHDVSGGRALLGHPRVEMPVRMSEHPSATLLNRGSDVRTPVCNFAQPGFGCPNTRLQLCLAGVRTSEHPSATLVSRGSGVRSAVRNFVQWQFGQPNRRPRNVKSPLGTFQQGLPRFSAGPWGVRWLGRHVWPCDLRHGYCCNSQDQP